MSDSLPVEDPGWIINEFLRRYIADQEAGHAMDLGDYQALWPGHDALIAEEHARLAGEAPVAPAPAASSAGALRPEDLVGTGRIARAWVVPGEDGESPRLLKRFEYLPLTARGEFAERLAALPSRIPKDLPGLAPIHAAGVDGGVAYLVTDRLSEHHLQPVDASDAGVRQDLIRGFARLARALHGLHQAGSFHGDLRPANVRFDAAGDMVITDAGWAECLGASWSLMVRDEIMGDLAYRAPEELLVNQTGGDAAADQHALAATAYYAFTGETVFQAADRAALGQAILTMPPRPLREIRSAIPRDLEQVLLRALVKDPAERWPDLETFAAALETSGRRRTSRIGRFLGRG